MKNKIIGIVIGLVLSSFIGFAGNKKININYNNKSFEAPSAISYQWYYNGEMIEGGNYKNLQWAESGEYKVVTVNNAGEFYEYKINVEVDEGTVRRIFVIGDSTASDYSLSNFPKKGWAQVLQPFFNKDSVTVVNKAISGRSSKSFYYDSNGWPVVLKSMGKGDFLFIQFGHNDSKSDTARHTDPYTTYQDYLSIYIDSARARGAYPVLLTSIHRNYWNGVSIDDSHGDYPPAMRALAVEKNVPLIDLHVKTKSKWEELGESIVTNNIYMHLPANVYTTYPTGKSDDDTHLQEEGAYEVCKLVIEGILELKDDPALKLIERNVNKAGLIKVVPEEGLSGIIVSGGVFPEGTEIDLTASPLSGFALSEWKQNDTVISNDIELSVIADDSVQNFTAVFDTGSKVIINRSPNKGGKVYGAGSYVTGREVTIYASPEEGYQFTGWKLIDDIVDTDTALTFTVGNENITYTAYFEEVVSIEFSDNPGNSIKIYQTTFNTLFIESGSVIKSVTFFDLSGRIIESVLINGKERGINLNKFNEGLYITRIKTSNSIVTKKVFIRK